MRDIHIKGKVFGILLQFDKPGVRCSSGVLATIQIEDDGVWHGKCVVDSVWLRDLIDTAATAEVRARRRRKRHTKGK